MPFFSISALRAITAAYRVQLNSCMKQTLVYAGKSRVGSLFGFAMPLLICDSTLLRIWDVFLLEGIKVLFRVSLALFIHQKPILLRQNDTLALWKSMKSAVSLTYDVDGLMKVRLLLLHGYLFLNWNQLYYRSP
ncbi:unnamed protein product [Dibothriocephalus latus]|uniref:Rab-GAP TBC domain-containing protein n=1 Tax=Dibothriocephalus latus TaxID=60516 RepID=A0A3P7LK87_DIBLA|nr:unnamed protein product [Dibothriocephalus latus]